MDCGMGCMTKLEGGGMLVDMAGIMPSTGRCISSGDDRSSSSDPNSFSSFSSSSSEVGPRG